MKIAHVADVHWGIGYPGPSPDSRFKDICNTMDKVADRIISEGCALVLFSGDAFKDAKVFLDRANLEIQAFTRWIRKLTEAGIEIIAISGTPSHDAVAGYELIKQMQIPGLTIATQPNIIEFEGPVSLDIACIPGLNRTTIANRDEYKGLSASEIHQLMTDHLTSLVRAQYTQCSSPCVLMTHMTCAGADTGFEDLLLQQEAVLTREAIDSTNFDLVALGHIHRPQRIEGLNTPAFYSGSPERLSFNDEKIQAGFWIHEIEADGYIGSKFIETPARQFITITLEPGQDVPVGIQDAIVRVNISCDEEQAKLISHQAIIKQCYDRQAFYVSEVRVDIQQKTSRVRAEAANAEMGPIDALRLWCEVTETADVDTLAARAESMLQGVSA